MKVENVQNAMDVNAEKFNNRMTLDISNAQGPIAYPIATYTYLIIYKTTMKDCEQATELFRYILLDIREHLYENYGE